MGELFKSSLPFFKTVRAVLKRLIPDLLSVQDLASRFPERLVRETTLTKSAPSLKVSIRGRILTGVITKMKMNRTVVIRRDYLHYVKKYNRFEKRHTNMSVHMSPCFSDVQVGDVATVGECRPLSKTVKFNTLKVTRAAGNKKAFKKF